MWREFRALTSPGVIHCGRMKLGWESDKRSRQRDKAESCRERMEEKIKWELE